MILDYVFAVSEVVTIDPKFKFLFQRTTVPYGRYRHTFDGSKIRLERDVQELVKTYPQITAELKAKDLERNL